MEETQQKASFQAPVDFSAIRLLPITLQITHNVSFDDPFTCSIDAEEPIPRANVVPANKNTTNSKGLLIFANK